MTLKELLGGAFKDGMTVEEIDTALSSVSLPGDDKNAKEIERLKQALSKSNSEAAENKRKLQEKQTEEERAKEEREKQWNDMVEENTTLKNQIAISTNKAQFLSLGYEDALATETAQAMVKGDTAKVFANQKKFLEAKENALRAELLKGTPTPPAGGAGDAMTKEKFVTLGYDARVKLATENPAVYAEMTKSE